MEMEILTVYGAHGDGGERGLGPLLGYFTDKKVAQQVSKGKGWYGGDGYISEKMAVNTGNGVYLIEDPKPIDLNNEFAIKKDQLKASALSKLTPDEIRALGINS